VTEFKVTAPESRTGGCQDTKPPCTLFSLPVSTINNGWQNSL